MEETFVKFNPRHTHVFHKNPGSAMDHGHARYTEDKASGTWGKIGTAVVHLEKQRNTSGYVIQNGKPRYQYKFAQGLVQIPRLIPRGGLVPRVVGTEDDNPQGFEDFFRRIEGDTNPDYKYNRRAALVPPNEPTVEPVINPDAQEIRYEDIPEPQPQPIVIQRGRGPQTQMVTEAPEIQYGYEDIPMRDSINVVSMNHSGPYVAVGDYMNVRGAKRKNDDLQSDVNKRRDMKPWHEREYLDDPKPIQIVTGPAINPERHYSTWSSARLAEKSHKRKYNGTSAGPPYARVKLSLPPIPGVAASPAPGLSIVTQDQGAIRPSRVGRRNADQQARAEKEEKQGVSPVDDTPTAKRTRAARNHPYRKKK